MEEKFEIDLKKVGNRIRTARRDLGLTQEKAAERTTLTAQFWSAIETGRERGSVGTYLQIAVALEMSLDCIFYDDVEIQRVQKVLSPDELISDCTTIEAAIISETILALKAALMRNRVQ